ncbi:MAG: hypothetical protein OSJ62_10050, partial [Lachnospiraceae bacterium]|nr:hypothetical protein [Lachnospiraceae bacterium]
PKSEALELLFLESGTTAQIPTFPICRPPHNFLAGRFFIYILNNLQDKPSKLPSKHVLLFFCFLFNFSIDSAINLTFFIIIVVLLQIKRGIVCRQVSGQGKRRGLILLRKSLFFIE